MGLKCGMEEPQRFLPSLLVHDNALEDAAMSFHIIIASICPWRSPCIFFVSQIAWSKLVCMSWKSAKRHEVRSQNAFFLVKTKPWTEHCSILPMSLPRAFAYTRLLCPFKSAKLTLVSVYMHKYIRIPLHSQQSSEAMVEKSWKELVPDFLKYSLWHFLHDVERCTLENKIFLTRSLFLHQISDCAIVPNLWKDKRSETLWDTSKRFS